MSPEGDQGCVFPCQVWVLHTFHQFFFSRGNMCSIAHSCARLWHMSHYIITMVCVCVCACLFYVCVCVCVSVFEWESLP